jgi:DNA-binding transcriptional MerR regulator
MSGKKGKKGKTTRASKRAASATPAAPKSQVIHVDFGRGRKLTPDTTAGGLVWRPSGSLLGNPRAPGQASAESLATDASEALAVTEVFSTTEAARLSGLSVSQLRGLDRRGIAPPSGSSAVGPPRGSGTADHGERKAGAKGDRAVRRRAYTFADLILLRTVAGLLAKKVPRADIASAVASLRASLGQSTTPTGDLRIVSDGKTVVLRGPERAYEPRTRQLVFDFEVKTLRDDVVAVLESAERRERQRRAYELYVRASQLDEDSETVEEAEALYRLATELDPWLAIAFTNLGNIHFRRGQEDAAMAFYARALEIDPKQPEAQYNTGYVLLDRGNPLEALPHFQGAVAADGRFADAHFYLAMAYESVGDTTRARVAWESYLAIEPTGTWADIARRHL